MNIGLEVVQLLESQKMSVRKLSEQSGVRRQSIARFLSGGNLHFKNLEKVLSTLGYKLSITKKGATLKGDRSSFLRKRILFTDKQIDKFCRDNGIKYMAIFGSVLTNDFKKDSDVDILIDLERPVSFFEFMALEEALKKVFSTDHELDIVTSSSVSPYIMKEIENNREVLYEKAA